MQIADLNFLVAEDDTFQRRWLVIMLTNLGAKNIVEAADGLAALHILQDQSRRIDISLIDLGMPGMDGIELIRHLAKESHQTSVILVSIHDSSLLFSVETMSRAYDVDMLGTIEKPATQEALLALIKRYQAPAFRHDLTKCIPAFTIEEIQQGLNNDEFEPLFQPKVELATGRVRGVEAFARWRHPDFGLISPAAFMPALEAHGEMDVLAWVVIKKSAAACIKWHERGLPISCSINLAPSSLEQASFGEKIHEYIVRQGIETQTFILELTESATVANTPLFFENIARLRMKGFGLSVDDYGAGHASMQQLLRIPFSELKIDRSFVTGAAQNHAMEMVLSSSFELCQKLKRKSVAVGIETRQDWDFLLKLGCTYAQGYYIAKPMEGDALPAWMAEWSQFF